MQYRTIMFNDSLFISLSQFVAIPWNFLSVSFYKEKQSEILRGYFYQQHSPNINKSDICRWVFKQLKTIKLNAVS